MANDASPPTLEAALPRPGEALPDDAVLSRFTDWVAAQGLTLYPHQEEALLELLAGRHLVLSTPTGSGKSLVATFLHFQAMCSGQISRRWSTRSSSRSATRSALAT